MGTALEVTLHGPDPQALSRALESVFALAERLDALLCDETRSTLTNQSVNHIRERIAEHARKRLISGRR